MYREPSTRATTKNWLKRQPAFLFQELYKMTHGNHVYLLNKLLTDGIIDAHLIERYRDNGGALVKIIQTGSVEKIREENVAFTIFEAKDKAKKKIAVRRQTLMKELESLDELEKRLGAE